MLRSTRSLSDRIETFEARIALTASVGVDAFSIMEGKALDARVVTASNSSDESPLNELRDRYGLTGTGQTVAIIDSGIAYDHAALGGGLGPEHRVVGGWDFTEENDADPYDDAPAGFHGTHVAGILASQAPEAPGVAPGVDLVALRVFNDQGKGDFAWIEQALVWVDEHHSDFEFPITTVNLSIGSDWELPEHEDWVAIERALKRLVDKGLFVSVAAGNDFVERQQIGLSYPASSRHVVPVASVGGDNHLSDFSQRASHALAAPGEDIYSTAVDFLYDFNGITDDFMVASGTSMAAPYVSGASVLVREAFERIGRQNIKQNEIYDHLFKTADINRDDITAKPYRSINLERAIAQLLEGTTSDQQATQLNQQVRLGHVDAEPRTLDIESNTEVHFTPKSSGLIVATTDHSTSLQVQSPNATHYPEQTGTLTFPVTANEPYIIRVLPSHGTTTVYFQQSIEVFHQKTVIHGTPAADHIDIRAGEVQMNETVWPLTDSVLVEIHGHQGEDSVDAWLSDGVNSTRLEQDQLEIFGTLRRFRLTGFEQATVRGDGRDDLLSFAGTSFDDLVYSHVNRTRIVNDLFDVEFLDQFATFLAGGDRGRDTIHLYDSHGSDRLFAYPSQSRFVRNGHQTSFHGFEDTSTYATLGGNDTAHFYDSQDNDRYFARPDRAWMKSSTSRNYAYGFDTTEAYATHGGFNEAFLYDSHGDDRFFAKADRSWLEGTSFRSYVYGFSRVDAYSTHGGSDFAYFYDSRGDDQMESHPNRSWMQGNRFYNYGFGFDRVEAYSTHGGRDTAIFVDSAASDTLRVRSDRQWLSGQGFFNYAYGFDVVLASSDDGNEDHVVFHDHLLTTIPSAASPLAVPSTTATLRVFGFDTFQQQRHSTQPINVLAIDVVLMNATEPR